jgi:FkbM family methyltransferase
MKNSLKKIKRNYKEGTLLKNGVKVLSNRVVSYCKYSNILIPFNKDRKYTRDYLKQIPTITHNHRKAANYYLDRRVPLSSKSIVYSLGILEDVAFEVFVKEEYDAQMYLYDPTPLTVAFMEKLEDGQRFNYFPYAVWTENKELSFTTSSLGGSSSAVFNLGANAFLAQAYTMQSLMEKNSHSIIDVWKADVEGAALPILEQMISQGIFASQIIVELERPLKSSEEMICFFERVTSMRNTLKTNGYEEFSLPREDAKYFSLELLFVRVP